MKKTSVFETEQSRIEFEIEQEFFCRIVERTAEALNLETSFVAQRFADIHAAFYRRSGRTVGEIAQQHYRWLFVADTGEPSRAFDYQVRHYWSPVLEI